MQNSLSRRSASYRRMSIGQRCQYLTKKTSGCWEWLGKPDAYGYGTIRFNGKTWKAHRLTYTLIFGEIDKGKDLDHLCRNRLCVNPKHLEQVTNRENILRGMGRGAMAARMSICANGHTLSGRNLYIAPKSKKRRCRICNAETARKWRSKKLKVSLEIQS